MHKYEIYYELHFYQNQIDFMTYAETVLLHDKTVSQSETLSAWDDLGQGCRTV